MHVNIQHRFNQEIGSTAMYYRLEESYRDVRGNVHSLIVLNIGFEPSLKPNDIRKIAHALSLRMKARGGSSLFGDWSEGLSDIERAKACEYWQRMIDEQTLDHFDKREQQAKAEAERYIDLDTVEHTEAREVDAEWLCKQTTVNALGEKVEFRQCSRPSKQAAEIYRKLNLKEAPFKKQKICRTQKSEKILQSADSGELRSQ